MRIFFNHAFSPLLSIFDVFIDILATQTGCLLFSHCKHTGNIIASKAIVQALDALLLFKDFLLDE